MKRYIVFCALIVLSGCSAHNPFIIKTTTDTSAVSLNKYSPHNSSVFITSDQLSSSVKYEVLETIEIGKVWYGPKDDIQESMANRARQIGADAVINFNSWYQPSGWSWAAPHGSGTAIKLYDKSSFDFSILKGNWK